MKYFFKPGYQTVGGEALSNTSVKQAVSDLVKREDNNWEGFGNAFRDDGSNNSAIRLFSGHVALGGALDRVGVTALGSSFSAGDIYAWYQEE